MININSTSQNLSQCIKALNDQAKQFEVTDTSMRIGSSFVSLESLCQNNKHELGCLIVNLKDRNWYGIINDLDRIQANISAIGPFVLKFPGCGVEDIFEFYKNARKVLVMFVLEIASNVHLTPQTITYFYEFLIGYRDIMQIVNRENRENNEEIIIPGLTSLNQANNGEIIMPGLTSLNQANNGEIIMPGLTSLKNLEIVIQKIQEHINEGNSAKECLCKHEMKNRIFYKYDLMLSNNRSFATRIIFTLTIIAVISTVCMMKFTSLPTLINLTPVIVFSFFAFLIILKALYNRRQLIINRDKEVADSPNTIQYHNLMQDMAR